MVMVYKVLQMLVSYTLDKTKRLQPLYIRDLTIKIPSILGTSNWTPYNNI